MLPRREFYDLFLEDGGGEDVKRVAAAHPMPTEVGLCSSLTEECRSIKLADYAILCIGDVDVEGGAGALGAVEVDEFKAQAVDMRKLLCDFILQARFLIEINAGCGIFADVHDTADLSRLMCAHVGIPMTADAALEGIGRLGGVAFIGNELAAEAQYAAVGMHRCVV